MRKEWVKSKNYQSKIKMNSNKQNLWKYKKNTSVKNPKRAKNL